MSRTELDGDVYIGGEPYDVLDDVKMLRHVPCGTALYGDGTIADHVCPPDVAPHRLDERRLRAWGPHERDCDGTLCDVCGCCQHCAFGDCGCAMATVATPFELTCPGVGCDCTGGGA